MKNYQRCLSCKGSKKMLGLGLIENDCKACDGQGWGKIIENENEYIFGNESRKIGKNGKQKVNTDV